MTIQISKRKWLSIDDKILFKKYLNQEEHQLSPYSFCNIYIWNKLFDVFWHVIDEHLCVFFKDRNNCFMYLSPLGEKIRKKIIDACFKVMDESNADKSLSRIENVEEKHISLYKKWGFGVREKDDDYIYLREDLAELRGTRYKSKRSAYNYFKKHYTFDYKKYDSSCMDSCLHLCQRWVENNRKKNIDTIYQQMLNDSFLCQKVALANFSQLDFVAKVIEQKGEIISYTIGYKLASDMFCNIFEVSDQNYKGLSQYIFREFCRELTDYKYINAMDDSGLKNLKKVKTSYRPLMYVSNYLVGR